MCKKVICQSCGQEIDERLIIEDFETEQKICPYCDEEITA